MQNMVNGILINQELLYCEPLETCVGFSAVSHCGDPHQWHLWDLSSIYGLP